MYTTLAKIRKHGLCLDGWAKLLRHLGKTKEDDEPLSIITVLDINGLDDALECLCAVDGHDRELRLFAVWCARRVQHRMTDPRSTAALDVAEQYANNQATQQDLDATREAAWEAAEGVVGDVAEAAAGAAAWATTREAAWEAAGDAAGAAAWAAAWDAEGGSAWGAAWDAAWDAQAARLREICATAESAAQEGKT